MKADDLTTDQLLEALGISLLALEAMRQGLKDPFLELLRAVQRRLYELEHGGPPADAGFN